MKKLKYIITRLKDINYKKMFETAGLVHKINKKFKLFIFFDMIFCAFKYGAGYNDYYSFGMYDMKKNERNTILTRSKNNTLVAQLNPKDYWHYFDNKNEFNEMFSKYLKRDWFFLEGKTKYQFRDFIKNHQEIIAKPNNDSGGHGIEHIIVKDYLNSDLLYEYLQNKKLFLLEEIVKQHDILNDINPSSVNTLRIITILKDNKVNFITCFLRIGNKDSFVDNTSSGGMLTMVGLNTGMTLYPACDGNMNIYDKHPATKKKIAGIKIPFFKETLKLVEELAKIEPNLKYIAWDIAITNNGPLLIEGNPYPGYYYQFPCHTPNKTGIMPKINEILEK